MILFGGQVQVIPSLTVGVLLPSPAGHYLCARLDKRHQPHRTLTVREGMMRTHE